MRLRRERESVQTTVAEIGLPSREDLAANWLRMLGYSDDDLRLFVADTLNSEEPQNPFAGALRLAYAALQDALQTYVKVKFGERAEERVNRAILDGGLDAGATAFVQQVGKRDLSYAVDLLNDYLRDTATPHMLVGLRGYIAGLDG